MSLAVKDLKRVDILIEGHVVDGAICHVELAKAFGDYYVRAAIVGLSGSEDLLETCEWVGLSEMRSSAWWQRRNANVVIAYGLSLSVQAAMAVRDARIRLIIEFDTVGEVSPRHWPMSARARMADSRHKTIHGLRVHIHWIWQVLFGWWAIVDRFVSLIKCADVVTVPSEEARRNLCSLLSRLENGDQCGKITVVPFAVRKEFTEASELPAKEKRIVVASRLDSHQKDPILMVKVLDRFLKRNPGYSVSIFSRGECNIMEQWAHRRPGVDYRVNVPRNTLREALMQAQVILYTSRFETVPIGGIEALCCGCTVVGPALPGIRELTREGEFGSVSKRRTARSLVAALELECKKWSEDRDPVQIAKYWRDQGSLERVSRLWLDLAFENKSPKFAGALGARG